MTDSIAVNFNQATYLKSSPDLEQLPLDEGAEVAFIGRSNAGKSSALNAITGIKNLARTSNTPGRTQMINFFELDDTKRLVDLPGYGYAKVPLVVKQRWEEYVNVYLAERQSLRGLVLVMDIRHPLKEADQHLIDWCVHCDVPLHILLTKSDKLKAAAARKTLKEVSAALEHYTGRFHLQIFSSLDRTGVEEAQASLSAWFTDTEES